MSSATVRFMSVFGSKIGGIGGIVGSHGSRPRLVEFPLPMVICVPFLRSLSPNFKEFQPYEGWEPPLAY